MLDSLYTGTAGIKANSTALGIVGANIANVNTVGYKTANTSFQNVLSTAMGSGRLGSKEVWNQGSLEQTAVTTDFAIVGDGLFQLKDAAGGAYYTRDGSFNLDENGLLTNTAGMKVQGFKIGNGGEIGAAGDIQIANVNSSPVATTKMGVDFNLDGQYRAASVMVDCADNFSSITYTAMTPGGDGNDTNVRYIDSGSGGPVVSSEGSSLTIDMGGRKDLTAAQAAAMVNAHFNVAAETEIGTGTAAIQFVAKTAGAAGSNIQIEYVKGTELDVAVETDASGTKTIQITLQEGSTTAEKIAAAVNADVEASALVTAIAKGSGAVGVPSEHASATIGDLSATPAEGVVKFEAKAAGAVGNGIAIEYVSGPTFASTTIGEGENAIEFVANTEGFDGNDITIEYKTGTGVEYAYRTIGDLSATPAEGVVKFEAKAAGSAGNDIIVSYIDLSVIGETQASATIGDSTVPGEGVVEFEADAAGADGNDIQIEYVKGTTLGVAVETDTSGTKTIQITLTSTTTATEIANLVNTPGSAAAYLVDAAVVGVGSDVVAYSAVEAKNLTGGMGYLDVIVDDVSKTISIGIQGTETDEDVIEVVNADVAASALVTATSLKAGTVLESAGSGTLTAADILSVAVSDDASGNKVIEITLEGGKTAEEIADFINDKTKPASIYVTAAGGTGVPDYLADSRVLSGGVSTLSVEVDAGSKAIKIMLEDGATSQDIVDLINDDAAASALVTATVVQDSVVPNDSVDAVNLSGAIVSGSSFSEGTFALEVGENYLFQGASYTTIGEADAAVLFSANTPGAGGDNLQIKYSTGDELSVEVDGETVTVILEDGVTAADIAAAVNADTAASALVTAYAGGNGEVPYEAVSETSLENGGSSTAIPPAQVTAVASGDGSGLITVSAPVTLSGGVEPEDYSTTLGVYDSLGNQIDLTVDYIFNPVLEMDEGGNLNTVSQWFWSVRSSEGNVDDINGILRFDSSGQLDRVKSNWTDGSGTTENLRDGGNPKIIVTDLNSGAADLNIEWDLSITTSVSGFAGLSEVTGQSQDGYASGSLTELSVDEDGVISGTFSNGATRDLYQVGVASFQNYDGLALKGTNVFTATEDSGAAMFGEAGSGGRGSISSGSLELSNVDLAEEFVNMITIQRAYQANSRVITTSSDILNELINLKR